MTRRSALSLLLVGAAPAAPASPRFRAGIARLCITPREPIWMAGYAARQHPSSAVAGDLWAKALALSDSRGGRVVILTMDLLRVPRSIANPVSEAVQRRYGLDRSQLLFNCSHNHSGPLLWENDPFTALSPEEYEKCHRYTLRLTEDFVGLVGAALAGMEPATIAYGSGEAGFGANRRVLTPTGYQIAYNPTGPVDRSVPVLRIAAPGGTLRALLFGYTCHNTAIGPASYEICGDYAGFAQAELERAHPGSTALFLQLCAGDQDPHPRGTAAEAERHGKALAVAVEDALRGPLREIRGQLRTSFRNVDLAFAPHTRETFEQRLNHSNPAMVRNARAMLKEYDEGHPIRSLSYPVQAVSFGRDLSLVALGGEPVVDYALRARREFPYAIVAGYSNSVKGYIPSRRVLDEGGYEGGDSSIYYGLPGPFTPAVEDTIFGAIRSALRETRR